ncbi:TonB-dependent receptor [Aquincola sp. MAHUQ-54]|uniref:TonB-dependent receptor n=1 Tax=Aquincola agrisoli TaxID=3119538 RepID=A0AAW9Q6Q2_9BURK
MTAASRTSRRRRHPLTALAAACACLGFAPAAWAQAAPAASASAPAADSPSTIVITGQKVRRTSQDTYTSTGVVSGQQLEDLNLRDLRDALKLQGNIYVAPSNNGNNGISIRGINSEGLGDPGGNMRPLTTLVIDGAAQSFEGVRRGQRGTWDVEQIEVARGPQSTLQGRNSLAGAVTVKTNDPTDFWEGAARLNAGEGDLFGRAAMLSGALGRDWSFRLAAESARGHKGIRYTQPIDAFLDDDEYRNVRAKLRWRPQALRGFEAKLTLSDTMDDPAVAAVSAPYFDRVYDSSSGTAEARRNKVRNRVLELSYELQPGVTVASITAHVDTDALLTGLGAIQGLAYDRDEVRADSDTTQEFRYTYAPPGSAITGVAGVFVGRFGNTRDSLVTVGGNALQDLDSQRRDRSAAVFGEATWAFHPLWKLTLGARYDHERSTLRFNDRLAGEVERSRFSHHAFLPKVALARELSPTSSLAFTVATGYRAGFREEGRDIDPEYLTSYEVAYRSSWLEGRMLLNANAFHYDWRDQQLSVAQGSAGLMTTENVGRSSVDGAELSLLWRQGRRLDVGGSLGLTRSKIEDGRMTVIQRDFSGKEFPEAPRLSGGLWATARFGSGWFVSADLAARSKAWATGDLDNQKDFRVPGRTILGLRGGYEGEWTSVVVWVDNLADKEYLTGRDTRGGAYVGDPRRVGVTLTARF